jgi:hypothetical protein
MPDTEPCPDGPNYTAAQLAEALHALGVRRVINPESPATDLTAEDIPTLLGTLLAATEAGIYTQALKQRDVVTAAWVSAIPANFRLFLLWRRVAQTTEVLDMEDTPRNVAAYANAATRVAEHLLAAAAVAALRGRASSPPTEREQDKMGYMIREAGSAAPALPGYINRFTDVLKDMGYRL